MQIYYNDHNMVCFQAKLGDILELRWEIMAMDEELDFFVRDCHAEPVSLYKILGLWRKWSVKLGVGSWERKGEEIGKKKHENWTYMT